MSGWNYGGDPANNPIDAARLRIGDTDVSDPILSDAEIAYYLDTYGPDQGASYACDGLLGKLWRRISKSVGPLSLQRNQEFQQAQSICESVKSQAASGSGVTSVGWGVAGNVLAHARSPEPIFRLHMHEGVSDAGTNITVVPDLLTEP